MSVKRPIVLTVGLILMLSGWLGIRWAQQQDFRNMVWPALRQCFWTPGEECIATTELGRKMNVVMGEGSKLEKGRRAMWHIYKVFFVYAFSGLTLLAGLGLVMSSGIRRRGKNDHR